MKRIGRPTKLTDAVQQAIVSALRAGNYVETAAQYAGINKQTVYNWIKHGEDGREPYKSFLDAIKKAQADSEARDVAIIAKAADSQWQAAAWRLERKFPDRWGRRDHMTVAGDKDLPILVVRKRGE